MKFLSILSIASVATLAIFLSAGCENDPVDSIALSITPSYAKLRTNQSVQLNASGGWNYKWHLSDPSAGSLSSQTGSSVTYTACKPEITQTITLTGMGSSPESPVGTNGTIKAEATATIVQ